jgi:hypothetical protein
VAELKKRTDIVAVHDIDRHELPDTAVIDSRDRVKPDLVGGLVVLHVRPTTNATGTQLWETLQAKKVKGDKKALHNQKPEGWQDDE